MSPFKLFLIAGAVLLFTAPALPETNGPIGVIVKSGSRAVVATERGSRVDGDAGVNVYTNFSLFVPGPGGDSDEARKARRSIYEMAGRECDLLREVLARECRLESLSTNISRQYGRTSRKGSPSTARRICGSS